MERTVVEMAHAMDALAREFYLVFRREMDARAEPAETRRVLVRLRALAELMRTSAPPAAADELGESMRAAANRADSYSETVAEYANLLAHRTVDPRALDRFVAREQLEITRELAADDHDEGGGSRPPSPRVAT
jgi:hypothetical protein